MREATVDLSHRFGDVSYVMLLDALEGSRVLHRPRRCARRFSWLETVYDEDNLAARDSRPNTLFLCRVESARQLLERHPSCFCVALAPDDAVPAWVSERNFGNRLVLVQQRERFARYDSLLRSLFVSNLIWENEMDRVVYAHGKLDRLIAVSERTLGNFVCITDTGHNLIACSRGIEPPQAEGADVYRALIEDGCYPPEEIAWIEESILPVSRTRSQLVEAPADERHPCPTLHYPVYIDGAYLFHVTMACSSGPADLLRDLFTKFMKRVLMLCTDFWKATVNLEAPWHRVFLGLINGEPMTDEYVQTQLAKTAVPRARQFRLLYVPFDSNMAQPVRAQVVEAARGLCGGACYPFMLKDRLLVLLYTESDESSALSGQSVWRELRATLYGTFGLQAGVSQAFRRIQDLEKAYREAFAAYSLRGPLKREYDALLGEQAVPCLPFEHALKFYLLTEGHDDDLVAFAFEDCILSRIIEEDRESGTSIAQMVWVYLSHGRNATETAKLMHVHRNTVLYHLSRIEERFDISFDSPLLRSRMVLDYQRLLLDGRV